MAASNRATVGTARAAAAAAATWTTYRHDGARSGVDPDSSSGVPPAQAWQTPALDGSIHAQPLVYGSTVIVATENDTVYALSASSGAIVWQKHLANPVPSGSLPCGNIGPTVGITGTPAIDPAAGKLFVVADTTGAGGIQHQLSSLKVSDGSVTGGPFGVDPPGAIPKNQLQRVGLALEAGKVVIGYGGNYGDCGSYHGWLVAIPEAGGSMQSFKVDPSSNGGAIWGSGNAPPVDWAGDVWVSTGNGSGSSYGYQESVIKLDANLGMLDHWYPSNWQTLDSSDADLGSSMPILLPGGLILQIGKTGVGYLLSSSHLGGIGGELFKASVCAGSYGGGIYVNGVIYVACSNGMHALSLDTAGRRFSPLAGWNVNGNAEGAPTFAGGLLWSAGWGNGTLYGLDPATGATRFSVDLGGFEHFTSPSAGGGELFVANRNKVTAFRIASYSRPPPPAPPPAPPSVSQLHVKVLHHRKLRLTFSLSEPATVTITLGRREWVVHFRGGTDRAVLSWRHLKPGRHRLLVVATDAAGHRSKRYSVSFRL